MLVDPIEEIQPEHRPFDEGFLYKQTFQIIKLSIKKKNRSTEVEIKE